MTTPPREESLFQAAVHLNGSARSTFLDGACHGDPALRARLDALLAAHEQPETVLATQVDVGLRRGELHESPTKGQGRAELDPPDAPDEAVGQTLGRYKLLERVGEGGCGVVYVAEQTEPVRRRVALKVIKLGMDTKQVVARFEAERQALAMMDHPNIAKVLDAGTTGEAGSEISNLKSHIPGGRPYFVMELVRGIKITDYCDQAQLSTKERLDLFIKVCQAIQHAHQKGIIHRDIKPSNILVTLHDGVPVPKVIDFGIAKATEGRLTDQTVYTQLHQFIGTPAYMSPEQAEMSGLDIDTRSDIYSLGVLLYELLAGSTPFDAKELMASGIDAMRKTIREKEPPRPSTKLTMELTRLGSAPAPGAVTGAPRVTRGATPRGRGPATPEAGVVPTEEEIRASSRRLLRVKETIHQLKGDLDWIVMKCLEKDRARRYDTATGLAADLKRHLSNEPVVARPPSAAYRFQKAFRRNRLVFTAGAAVAAALVVGLGISTWAFIRESHAYERTVAAEQEQKRLRVEAEAAQRTAAQQRDLASERLYESLVREARSIRKARQVGYRREAFDRLKQAITLGTTNADFGSLRREATACLGDWVGLDPVDISLSGRPANAALTADGSLAAIAESDGNVTVRETRTGREVARIETAGTPTSLAFDHEGLALFVGVTEGEIVGGRRPTPFHHEKWSLRGGGSWKREWKRAVAGFTQLVPTAGEPVALVLGAADACFSVVEIETDAEVVRVPISHRMPWLPLATISADRRQLAFFSLEGQGGVDVQLEVWDLASQTRLAELRPRLGPGWGLTYAPDGRSLAATYDNTLEVYDTVKFSSSINMGGAFENSFGAAIGGASALLAVPSIQEFAVRLIRLQSGGEVAYLKLPSAPVSLRFSEDGSVLLLTHTHGSRVVHLDTRREALRLRGHTGGVPAVEFSPDGKQLASAGKDRTLRLWDLSAPGESRVLATLSAPAQTLAYAPQSDLLVCGYYNTPELSLWSPKTGVQVGKVTGGASFHGTTWACAISPDGKHLAAVGEALRVWDLARLTQPTSAPGWTDEPLFTETNGAAAVAFDPAGNRVAYLSVLRSNPDFVTEILVRDLVPGAHPAVVATNNQDNFVQGHCFLPKSGALAYVTRDREIAIVDPTSGQLLRRYPTLGPGETSRAYVANLRASPDESKLAMVTPSGLGVDLWDPATGKLLYTLPEEADSIWWLAWSPDSQRLAVTRANGEVTVWNLKEVEAQLVQLGLPP